MIFINFLIMAITNFMQHTDKSVALASTHVLMRSTQLVKLNSLHDFNLSPQHHATLSLHCCPAPPSWTDVLSLELDRNLLRSGCRVSPSWKAVATFIPSSFIALS
eukprot:TRINITY_DN1729_c0_g1_i6.p1 TRINITY_DN1729_c0_g1~~TRINITY_DN1729_c0_g1_i6.p1  ORF type:complete len:105 (+),score=7.47 TRINITY_DN1729_c0_g1_i6:139-453(+)